MSVVYQMDAGKVINMTEAQRGVVNGTLERYSTSRGQRRPTEIRTNAQHNTVLILVAPADDLGHVFEIGPKGEIQNIGQTEA